MIFSRRVINMNEEMHSFEIELSKTGPMEFTTKFDKDFPDLYFDEPRRSGGNNKYPNASRILTAAVANCLSASLTFCLAKTRIEIPDLHISCKATCFIERNENQKLRVKKIDVQLYPKSKNFNDNLVSALDRCKERFAEYCVVSQSVKKGFDVNFNVN